MRTVTFSDARVSEAVNSRFVPVWYNRGRGFHNCDPVPEKRIFEGSGDVYPTKNICTFFLTPDLEVLTYASGYYSPDLFLDLLDSASRLHAAPKAERARAHREIAAALARRLGDVQQFRKRRDLGAAFAAQSPILFRKEKHAHTAACLGVVEGGLAYRKRVHETLAQEAAVPFEQVQHTYLFGNSFSEEPPPSLPTEGIAPPQVPAPGR